MDEMNIDDSIKKQRILEKIEDAVALLLSDKKPEQEEVINLVTLVASAQHPGELSEENIHTVIRRVEARFDILANEGILLTADNHQPWLENARESVDWYYWGRYRRLLAEKKRFSRTVINVLDMDTDKIINRLEDPSKEGSWRRKGLCVGHVQSGKTANYLGVICKAADAGYRVIIVMAGLLNDLRNQTQERVDEGFVGIDSSRILNADGLAEKFIGVGKLDNNRWPFALTTNTDDFDKQMATKLRANIDSQKEPVVLVIKKNVSILQNLISWLKQNHKEFNSLPMLLVDDEADHASINTNKEDEDPTTTNKYIRELLNLFPQSSYLGYTATPFANIFINPESDDEMFSDDLFPRDFIISLDTPTNYVGAKRIFEDDGDLDIVRVIDDYKQQLPLKHKKEEFPDFLPGSLCEAVRSFVIARAIRLLRGQVTNHNSMLVNVSRFTGIQSRVKLLIHEYITQVRHSVSNFHGLPEVLALDNSDLLQLKQTWGTEFSNCGFSWIQVQKQLNKSISPIRVMEVNAASSEPLDYSRHSYPNGLNVIAVGGLSLSRGLTLEGLTVTYFLRNSKMYDTLFQMGRWFGYRPEYEDLCRVYMSEEANSWYAHISQVTDELRDEFRRMEQARMTPQDFGLCVRSHPQTLIVTAKNKMRTGKQVPREINLEGRLVETSVLIKNDSAVKNNLRAVSNLLKGMDGIGYETKDQPGYLYRDVPVSTIVSFIDSFNNHPVSQMTQAGPLLAYTEWLEQKGVGGWDVVFISLKKKHDNSLDIHVEGLPIIPQKRTVIPHDTKGIELNKRRLASRGHEKSGLSKEQQLTAEKRFLGVNPSKEVPDSAYRVKRTKPLLMIHILDCRYSDDESSALFPNGAVAYGVSFPGTAGSRRPEKLVEYVVNTVWWNKHFGDLEGDDE